MAANKITIKFNSQGDRALLKALKNLAKAQNELTRTTKKFGKVQDDTSRKGRLLNNAFATMRSKILLASFAMTLLIKPLMRFAKEAAKIESMSRAFNTLSGGVSNASIAMSKLRAATNNTMTQFDLFQQANNAMILGITKNSDEMAEMFDIAQRLGRALGVDTKRSVESLITGIGRQSRLMLDNIGIIVKADEAYGSYAKRLGTTADKLTDAQKKQAFLQATMESARAKVASLGTETLTSQDSFDRFSATVSDLSVAVGDNLKGAFSGAMDAFVDFIEVHKSPDVKAALDSQQYEMKALTVRQLELELRKAASASQVSMNKMFQAAPVTIMSAEVTEKLKNQIKQLREEMEKISPKEMERKRGLELLIAVNKARIRSEILASEEEENAHLKRTSQMAEWGHAIMDLQPKQFNFSDGLILRSKMIANAQREASQQFKDGLVSEVEAMEWFRNRVKIIDAAILKSKTQGVSGMIGAFGQLNTAAEGSSRASARLAQISATIDALAGANKAFAQGGIFGFATGAAILASGAANVVNIEKNIGKFEQGGMVGGRRHSQGGTIIEAEQGEFVMSRNAVNAVGVEAMNRINAGGGAGAVNVNFTGNVMSQDFIEYEAIPMIKEAIRRGADIGVA